MQILFAPQDELLEVDFPNDMKLRDEDRQWLQGEISQSVNKAIQDATNQFRPHGWRRVTNFLRDWGLAGTNITVIIALLGLLMTAVYQATARVGKEATFEATTTSNLSGINDHLKKIDETLASIQLADLGENPLSKKNALAARKLVTNAQVTSVRLPSDLVEEVGQKFVSASKDLPEAWGTAIAFVNYKSSITSHPAFVPILPTTVQTHYDIPHPSGTEPPALSTVGATTKDASAQFDVIGRDVDAGALVGAGYIIADGGSITLDNIHLKNVVLRNVHVYYTGGPMQLENVYFVNCTFDMPENKRSQDLALAALASGPSLTFSS